MLNFARRPDGAFIEIVEGSLDLARGMIDDRSLDDEMAMSCFSSKVSKMFSRSELSDLLLNLSKAHKSTDLYMLTDYHFLVLHDVLGHGIDIHNDLNSNADEGLFSDCDLKEVSLTDVEDVYFWDADFETTAEEYDALDSVGRELMGYTPEVYGISHGLKPQPHEIRLRRVSILDEWDVPKGLYMKGASYPAG